MKKLILSFLIVCSLSAVGICQNKNDQRTVTTRIADLLAQMPAQNSAQLNSAMEEMSALGEHGIASLAGMLSSDAQSNAKIEYAINSYSYYVMQQGKEQLRKAAAQGYADAISKLGDKVNKQFLISQLQEAGKEEVVPVLATYLNDEQLCDPAARALVKVNSAAANTALKDALAQAKPACVPSLIQALGDAAYSGAVELITPYAASQDAKIRKVALYALANIADPSSNDILARAATASNLRYDNTEATAAYLLYAENLLKKGNHQLTEQIAGSLLKNAGAKNQVHTRTAALKLIADSKGPQSVPALLKAASGSDLEYAAAALKFSANYLSPDNESLWLKKFKKVPEAVQPSWMGMFGDKKVKSSLPLILKKLKSKKPEVQLAAIHAAGKIGGEQVVPDFIQILKKGNKEEIAAVRDALMSIPGNQMVAEIAKTLPDLSPDAQVAVLSVLSGRAAHDQVNSVFPLVKNSNQDVRLAALTSLKDMAEQDNLPQLFSLLNQADQKEELEKVQQAIIEASATGADSNARAAMVLQEMNKAAGDKKVLFYNILAGIGGKDALKAVSDAFASGDPAGSQAAVEALSKWVDVSAARPLYSILSQPSNSAYLDAALKGYVRLTSLSKYPAEQKVLMLRNAMESAATTAQKQMILKELDKNKTFNALIFAGKYLDDPALQQEAAMAVMNIALSSTEFSGPMVKDLLTKTISVLKGNDSNYMKEAIRKYIAEMPAGEGFVPLFNGKDLTGWKGLVANPIKRAQMDAKTLAKEQAKADAIMRKGWYVKDGVLNFSGEGENICTVKKYGDIDMYVDWRITKDGDAGIYLRGTPQVQIWDTSRVDVGAQVGSGGLYNNQVNESKPLKLADNAVGEWNNFHIKMVGDRVTVYLNGELVVDNVPLENFWDRSKPIFPEEQLELQAHGTHVQYRDIYVKELPRADVFKLTNDEKKQGFKVLFDGTNMHEWIGNKKDYIIEDGNIVIYPRGGHGNLYTKDEYKDFVYRFEFKLTPGANNGLGVRAPLEGDAAYQGMEIQILDNDAPEYRDLKPYQYHGSVYGTIPAKRGFLKPTGEWNYEEVTVRGPKIKVVLNGTTILDGDISDARKNGTLDHLDHPGLQRESGHIGFLGHGSEVRFRNIRVKDLSADKESMASRVPRKK